MCEKLIEVSKWQLKFKFKKLKEHLSLLFKG